MSGGLYVLFVRVPGASPLQVTVGAQGPTQFRPGTYVYVGSAHGPGGFARIDRHATTAAGDHETRHWHIDYLLAHPRVALPETYRLPGRTRECDLATAMPGAPLVGFGASDCACPAHLLRLAHPPSARIALERFRTGLTSPPGHGRRPDDDPTGPLDDNTPS